MSELKAEDFVNELISDSGRLWDISRLPANERRGAIRALGYNFTSREIDDYICKYAERLRHNLALGEEDFRDVVMKNWGNCMD
ncbi:MAG: hypothetical protein Q4D58_00585 [Synergistaceae bacterium]|nr:hypothetical protein [Synergistaceae bacterium]